MLKKIRKLSKALYVIGLLSITSCSASATEEGVRVRTKDGGFAMSKDTIIWIFVGVGLLVLITSAVIVWAHKRKK